MTLGHSLVPTPPDMVEPPPGAFPSDLTPGTPRASPKCGHWAWSWLCLISGKQTTAGAPGPICGHWAHCTSFPEDARVGWAGEGADPSSPSLCHSEQGSWPTVALAAPLLMALRGPAPVMRETSRREEAATPVHPLLPAWPRPCISHLGKHLHPPCGGLPPSRLVWLCPPAVDVGSHMCALGPPGPVDRPREHPRGVQLRPQGPGQVLCPERRALRRASTPGGA